jgi:hypothetical protein
LAPPSPLPHKKLRVAVFGYACYQSWQMGVNLSGASNVWALLAECTYVYSRYVWLYYWG